MRLLVPGKNLEQAANLPARSCQSLRISDCCQVTAMQNGGGAKNGAIVINEPSAAPETGMAPALGSAEKRSMQADADYARQLQAKMDVQEARATNK